MEVIFDHKLGYVRETASDHGNILGFSVLKVSALKKTPLEVAL